MPTIYQGPQIGKYGVQGGGIVEFEWVPDPIVFSDKVLDIRDALEDRTEPLIASSIIMANDIRENFEGEHDPEGTPWAPWSTGYHTDSDGRTVRSFDIDPVSGKQTRTRLGYAENLPPGHSGKILHWRGILEDAATSEGAFVQVSGQTVNDDSLFFDTGGLPPYWVYHQQPTSPNTGNIPQRRFLGMSGEAEILILEAFDDWFQGILEIATSSRGRLFLRRRDPVTKRFMSNV